MTIALWQKFAVQINEIFEKNEADAVVITHGTDTQEETSYFLDLTVNYKNAVVITGSMRPAGSLRTARITRGSVCRASCIARASGTWPHGCARL